MRGVGRRRKFLLCTTWNPIIAMCVCTCTKKSYTHLDKEGCRTWKLWTYVSIFLLNSHKKRERNKRKENVIRWGKGSHHVDWKVSLVSILSTSIRVIFLKYFHERLETIEANFQISIIKINSQIFKKNKIQKI